ncbi:LLM class F420-dependent oxidoreductase [Nocardioides kongjuensis]|uniref:F420-dependent oxidoreductase-like protein n=1 Tax=Nocardioides kongjuensis TaxID=349522 RepID=A0A852RG20_9ACTN|nr:LLM class F420-dependent oxidoreductase [Nocardioides kongjuensis]NYD29429.1 F420-dependent oxidoreductase-like protein [Nocardioides kongjuensis]
MELRVFTEPQQGATYDDLLAVALEAERLGFAAFFRSDHYLHMSGDGLPGSTDAWTTLAGLARDTRTIRLGTMMTSATFRYPGVLAIQVAQVDQMSGGRVELGIGAGWFTQEHTAYGIPFPDTRERFERYAEQLELITGLWSTPLGERYAFDGVHYQLSESPALPKPVQTSGLRGGVPLLVGGKGARRTPALAAAYADEFNLPFVDEEFTALQFGRVRRAAEEIGRDPDSITWSNALVLCVGEDEAAIARRAAAIGREVDELRENGLAGTPEEVVAKIRRYGDLGAQRIYLQVLDLGDLDHLRLVAAEVMPHV